MSVRAPTAVRSHVKSAPCAPLRSELRLTQHAADLRCKVQGPTSAEVEHAVSVLTSRIALQSRSPAALMGRVVAAELFPSHDDGSFDLRAHLATLDRDAVAAACSDLLQPERYTVCELLPDALRARR